MLHLTGQVRANSPSAAPIGGHQLLENGICVALATLSLFSRPSPGQVCMLQSKS